MAMLQLDRPFIHDVEHIDKPVVLCKLDSQENTSRERWEALAWKYDEYKGVKATPWCL
jgi:hypothetical protein